MADRSSWLSNRRDQPHILMQDEVLTDLTIHILDFEFKVHKLILVCHSEYFYRMLITSRMKEADENVVKLNGINPEVFGQLLEYIYTGQLATDDEDLLAELYLTSDMFQMEDLQDAILRKLGKQGIRSQNPLKIYFMLRQFPENKMVSSVLKNVRICLDLYLADCWGDLLKHDAFQSLTSDELNELLEIKSSQEELSDFSFSFTQSDIAEAVVKWTRFDLKARHTAFKTLSRWFCLHQLNSASKQNTLTLIHEISRTFSSSTSLGERFRSSLDLDDLCNGLLCPKRRLSGLVVIHGWTPSQMNHITADHITYNFYYTDTE